MSITIYHNPSCGTSRNALAMIRQSNEEPEIIEYLQAPPTRERLIELEMNFNADRSPKRQDGRPLGERRAEAEQIVRERLEREAGA